VTPGSPLTIRIHPGSMTPGFVASDGYRSAFQAWSWRADVWKARAMLDRLSPALTT
jgi:hypothetical protein